MNTTERRLSAQGYSFSGIYTTDKEEAKRRAAELRKQGTPACVVTKVYPGRVYSTTGHCVWTKGKPHIYTFNFSSKT